MKIAVTSTGPDLESELDPRFGRARYFIIIDTETNEFTAIDNLEGLNAYGGAGVRSAGIVADHGVSWVITGNVGPKAAEGLKTAGIKVALSEPIKVSEVVEKFKKGELKEAQGI